MSTWASTPTISATPKTHPPPSRSNQQGADIIDTNAYYNADGTPLLRPFGDGWRHPDLTYAQQTEAFVAAVTVMHHQSRDDYLGLCDELAVAHPTVTRDDIQKPDGFDPENPIHLAIFEYGRYWQARETLFAFAGQLGMEGYEDHAVVAYVQPVPDDPASLYE